MLRPRNADCRPWILLAAWLLWQPAQAQTNVILHLKNGDRIAGTIVSEDTNRVVVSTGWIKELPVPQSVIDRRDLIPSVTPPPAATNLAAKPPPPPPAATSNAPAAKPAPALVAAAPAPPVKPPPPKHWKANVFFGADLLFGAVDRELYYSRLKFTYELPYKSDPKKFFRSIFTYDVDYGRTKGVESANRMESSFKIDFDVGRRIFVYNQVGIGYDEIRKIDLHYEVGPGVGYHLLTYPKLVMNVESGLNYQVQNRKSSSDVRSLYLRLAEDVTWKLTPRVTFTEKFEFFPNLENSDQFRARMDATLSFGFWKNLSVKLTALDLYDTNPARNVDKNELQIRSGLGVDF